MAVANAKPNAPLKVQKSTAETLTFTISDQDLSAKTMQFRVKQYSGASSYEINIAATSSTYSAPDTTVTVDLSTTNTNISWSRGVYTLANLTDNISVLVGEFLVEDWGF